MATVQMTPEQQATANMGGKFTSTVNPNDQTMTLEQLNAAYAAELEKFKADTAAQLRADEEAFAKARAEIEAMAAQEQSLIQQQTTEYEATQQRIRDEMQAQAQAVALEQARIQKDIADTKAAQEAAAAKARGEMEGMQRTAAQKEVASRKAGRSAGARPLLGAATPTSIGQKSQTLGGEASLAGEAGTLGAAQTLGA